MWRHLSIFRLKYDLFCVSFFSRNDQMYAIGLSLSNIYTLHITFAEMSEKNEKMSLSTKLYKTASQIYDKKGKLRALFTTFYAFQWILN